MCNMLVDFESGGSVDEAVNAVTGALTNIDLGDPVVEEKNVSGTFLYPGQELNLEVFLDVVLNDLLFSSLLAVNESKSVIRKKNTVYVYFKDLAVGTVTATVSPKVVGANDPIWKTQPRNAFHPGPTMCALELNWLVTNKLSIGSGWCSGGCSSFIPIEQMVS